MGYQGRASFDKTTQTLKLDTLASAFNGAQTVFSLTSGNRAIYPATTRNLLISINGVVQEPDAAFTVNGSSITFTSAPATNATFFGVLNGQPNDLVLTPSVQSITVNNTMVVNASGFYAGTNVVANTTTVFVGNSSVNTAITAGSIAVNGGAATLSQTFRGLTLRTHPDADVAASKVFLNHADEIVMHDGTRVADWNNLVANITASGAGGLDTGSEAASTWYEIHAIRKSSDGTKNLLLHRAKNYGADQTFGGDSSNDNVRVGAADRVKLAQGFQITTAGPLPFIDLQINKTNSPVGNLWATIESDSAGNPSGTALATSDKFDVSLVPTTRGWIRFVFRTSPTLSASTQYHIVLQGDWTMNGTNVVAWRGDNTGYANGSGKKYDGTNWAAAGVSDFAFKTYITQNDTAVTMPSGYDQRALVGYVYNDSSSDFMVMRAVGRVVSSGGVTLGTYTTTMYTLTDLSVVVPPVPVVAKFMSSISGATDSTLAGMADLYYDAAGRDPRNLITLPTSSRYYGPMYMPLTLPQAVYFMNNNTLGTISAYCSGYEW